MIMCNYDISITMHLYDWIYFSEAVDCSVCWHAGMSDSRSRGSEKAEMLQIRAVYYEPRPVGLEPHEFGKSPVEEHLRNILRLISVPTDCKVRLSPDSDNDLYTSAFRNMHQRDLYIMRSLG